MGSLLSSTGARPVSRLRGEDPEGRPVSLGGIARGVCGREAEPVVAHFDGAAPYPAAETHAVRARERVTDERAFAEIPRAATSPAQALGRLAANSVREPAGEDSLEGQPNPRRLRDVEANRRPRNREHDHLGGGLADPEPGGSHAKPGHRG